MKFNKKTKKSDMWQAKNRFGDKNRVLYDQRSGSRIVLF